VYCFFLDPSCLFFSLFFLFHLVSGFPPLGGRLPHLPERTPASHSLKLQPHHSDRSDSYSLDFLLDFFTFSPVFDIHLSFTHCLTPPSFFRLQPVCLLTHVTFVPCPSLPPIQYCIFHCTFFLPVFPPILHLLFSLFFLTCQDSPLACYQTLLLRCFPFSRAEIINPFPERGFRIILPPPSIAL